MIHYEFDISAEEYYIIIIIIGRDSLKASMIFKVKFRR